MDADRAPEEARALLDELNRVDRQYRLHELPADHPLYRSGEINGRVRALKDAIIARGFRAEWNGSAYELIASDRA